MPPISDTGKISPAVPPISTGGHGDHAATVTSQNGNAGQTFSATLAQVLNEAPGGATHGNHGNALAPSGGTNPQHFQIGNANHGAEHGIQATMLGIRAYRQQIIASNIANADTPGYKAVDVDFQQALRAQSSANTSPLALSTTASGHVSGQAMSNTPTYALKYHVPSQASADGNTVEIDVERAKFAENSMMYEFSLDRVSGHFKMMMELFQNLKN